MNHFPDHTTGGLSLDDKTFNTRNRGTRYLTSLVLPDTAQSIGRGGGASDSADFRSGYTVSYSLFNPCHSGEKGSQGKRARD